MLKFNKLKFEDVKTSDFGDEITIRVNEESIKCYARKVVLQKKVEKMKLSDEDQIAYNVAINLMSLCTYPDSGEYCFNSDQLSDFVDSISPELFFSLSQANRTVNPSLFEEVEKTLTAKKKST